MANHQSAEKRIRQSAKRRTENRYYGRTMRGAVRKLRKTNDKKDAEEQLPKVTNLIDKLAKKGVIHKNKASNLKSKLAKHVNSL